MSRLLIGSILLCLGGISAVLGQGLQEDASRTAKTEARIQEVPNYMLQMQDYRIAAGDVLEIQVVGAPELTQTTKVSASGEINFLPAGPIYVMDLTAAELEARVNAVLQEKKLVVQPQSLVFVREYNSKHVYTTGEFVRPGEIIMSKSLTVVDTILLAGGLTPLAGRYAYLHHNLSKDKINVPPSPDVISKPDASRDGTEITQIDLQPFREGRLPEPDIVLRPGDYLIVPRRNLEYYYVLGEVMAPFNYVYPLGQTLMASQAISSAGGPTVLAKMSKGILVRIGKDGKRQELKVDYAAILEGREKDFEIRPSDIIFIPGSGMRQILEGYIIASNAIIGGVAFSAGRNYQLPESSDQPSGE